MRENFTRIAIVLDRSGSMETCRESTITGFNSFIKEQQKLPGEATVKLVQFDDQYEQVFDRPLSQVSELTQSMFVPRGMTALLDAQGKTIVALGAELDAMPEDQRPSKVIVVTITDGAENSSKEWTQERVAALIKDQRDKYNWDFVFLGANQDAIKTAAKMNIPMASSITYNTSHAGIQNTMCAVSNYVGASRSGNFASFTSTERAMAMESDDDNGLSSLAKSVAGAVNRATAAKR